eukprot:CAMPEP_0177698226 /NCGR_PEP_ID=MMETSP0484_2-20121128/4928_1 /TAXON_ID=354590 /ORGANISM="Rhodomonas lens, Strain RHODO" /LENGTH=69 /DNA_ID=CAMNT_0019209305 /DNA_START=201 /DNA_END=410 /DNA_ORIENTATION=+
MWALCSGVSLFIISSVMPIAFKCASIASCSAKASVPAPPAAGDADAADCALHSALCPAFQCFTWQSLPQ